MDAKVKEYIAAASSFVVVLRDFLLWSKTNSNSLICAYEGLDHYYYDSRIRAFVTAVEVAYFHMKGKRNVQSLLEIKDSNTTLAKLKLAFFVDSDFSVGGSGSPHLYTTPGYSIENNYVTRDAIRRFLRSGFDLRELAGPAGAARPDPELDTILNFCDSVFTDFERLLAAPLHAFLSTLHTAWVASGNLQNYPTNTKEFDKKIFLTLFEIGQAGFSLTQELSFEKLVKWFAPPVDLISEKNFDAALVISRQTNLRKFGRGKFHFMVLMSLIEFLIGDAKKSKPKVFSEKRKCLIEFAGNPALLILSPFADSDNSLASYMADLKTHHGIS